MTSYVPSKKDGAVKKAPKTKVFFENPKLEKLFHAINSRFSAGKNVYVEDEKDGEVFVLYPTAVVVRKTVKSIVKKEDGMAKPKEVEAIKVEYTTKTITIWVDLEGKMQISIETEIFTYCQG